MFNKTVHGETTELWPSMSAVYDDKSETVVPENENHQLYNLTEREPQALISNEDYKTAAVVIECGIFPPIILLGISSNIVNMVVFYRQGLSDKMNLCLFALAFVDFMFAICFFLSLINCAAFLFPGSLLVQILKWNTLRFTLNFWNAFWYSSGVLTAIIAAERCICVVWPLKSATIFTTKRMAWLIFVIIIVMNLLCLPYALKHVVRMITDESGNAKVIMDDTDLYNNNKLAFLIVRDGVLSSISFATFLIVSFVTVVTVRKLKTAMDWRQKTSSNVMDKRQMTLVKILITVSCFYIICNIPLLSIGIVKFVVDDFSTLGRFRNLFYITHPVGYAFLMINSSVNIFIYFRQSSRFRKELRACVCCFRNMVE